MNSTGLIAAVLALCLMAAAGVLNGEAPRTGAAVEIQAGPVLLAIAGPSGPAAIKADTQCGLACPLFEMRVRLGPPQGAPGETGRVQRLGAGALQRERLAQERGYEMLGEKGSVGETARAEPAEDEDRGR